MSEAPARSTKKTIVFDTATDDMKDVIMEVKLHYIKKGEPLNIPDEEYDSYSRKIKDMINKKRENRSFI